MEKQQQQQQHEVEVSTTCCPGKEGTRIQRGLLLKRCTNVETGSGSEGTGGAVSGDVVLEERPLCAMRQFRRRRCDEDEEGGEGGGGENRAALASSCANCFKFVGSLERQARIAMKLAVDATDGTKEENAPASLSTTSSSSGPSMAREGTLPRFPDLPDFSSRLTETCVPCTQQCGLVYCSDQCRKAHWERAHRLLCVGALDDPSHALIQFKMHAMETNDIFLLAAEVVASILVLVLDGQAPDDAAAAYTHFERGPWWETSSAGDPELAAQMHLLVEQSSNLLFEAMLPHSERLPNLFSPDEYGSIIGTFERNNIGISVPSPLVGYATSATTLEHGSLRAAASASIAHVCRVVYYENGNSVGDDDEEEEEEEEDDCDSDDVIDVAAVLGSDNPDVEELLPIAEQILPGFDGTGLYTKACMLNHSCNPNVRTTYSDDGRGAVCARVIALCNIRPGEELRHSYIDEEADLEERQAVLRDNYGFVCSCIKCEEQLQLSARRKGKEPMAM